MQRCFTCIAYTVHRSSFSFRYRNVFLNELFMGPVSSASTRKVNKIRQHSRSLYIVCIKVFLLILVFFCIQQQQKNLPDTDAPFLIAQFKFLFLRMDGRYIHT